MYIIQVIFYWTMSPATELRLFHSLMHTDYVCLSDFLDYVKKSGEAGLFS